ncbi:MAG TPA: hypothetical protein VG498_09445 [Terriglobales bacterium]|nr:hypothetical protein [Terriglobales bacterium]
MKSIDEEWSRLTDLYTQMSEGELEKLASEAYELTDMARDALRGEISRRGLKVELRTQAALPEVAPPEERPEGFDPEQLDLVGVGRAYDLEEARRLRQVFDQAGIPSYFGPENVENVEKLKSSFDALEAEAEKLGFKTGIDVKVPSSTAQLAYRALAQAPRDPDEDNDSAEDEADYMAVCPRCHSSEIVFQGLDENSSKLSDDAKYSWSCDACGYQWKDDGVEEQNKAAS